MTSILIELLDGNNAVIDVIKAKGQPVNTDTLNSYKLVVDATLTTIEDSLSSTGTQLNQDTITNNQKTTQ